MRYENITISRLAQTVYNTAGNTLIESDECALGRLYIDLEAGELGNKSAPRTRSVDQHIAADHIFFFREIVAYIDALYDTVFDNNADGLCIGLYTAAVALCRLNILPGHAETIDSGIRHTIGSDELR